MLHMEWGDETWAHHALVGLEALVCHIKMVEMQPCCHLKLLFYSRGHFSLLLLRPLHLQLAHFFNVCILTSKFKGNKANNCYREDGIIRQAQGLKLLHDRIFLDRVQRLFYRLLVSSLSKKD